MRRVDVLGVRVSTDGTRLVVCLQEGHSGRVLPIVVGAREGAAIASAQAGVVPPRPLTHDLVLDLLRASGQTLVQVRVTHQADGVYFAEIHLSGGAVVDARPSDAIALALRGPCPILCDETLLGRDPDEDLAADRTGAGVQDASRQVEEFSAFLQDVQAEDFRDPGRA